MSADLVRTAREWINRSRYRFLSEESDPPHVVNCYTFTTWVFGQCQKPLPRTLKGQLYRGRPVALDSITDGVLVFTTGHRYNLRDTNRAAGGVGHVAIGTELKTVIHASWRHGTVVEESLESLISGSIYYRGVYRV